MGGPGLRFFQTWIHMGHNDREWNFKEIGQAVWEEKARQKNNK